MSKKKGTAIAGSVEPGFEAVREAFIENFTRRNELGAACCIYYQGQKVVDLWGGIRNKATGEPWEEDTMVCVFSTAKGMSGLAMALAHSRGLLDYEERVCTYWPEFAQQGKEKVTVRQLLSHQAGLFAFDEPPHVHAGKEGKEAKYWMTPVALARSRGFRDHELTEIERILVEYQDDLGSMAKGAANDSKMTFTPADFCIGESGIWFFSLMWEHGKDADPKD